MTTKPENGVAPWICWGLLIAGAAGFVLSGVEPSWGWLATVAYGLGAGLIIGQNL